MKGDEVRERTEEKIMCRFISFGKGLGFTLRETTGHWSREAGKAIQFLKIPLPSY